MALTRKWWRKARHVPVGVAVAGICYLALKPSPQRTEIPLMPHRLGVFLDQQDFLCNVAGFLVLTAIVHGAYQGARRAPAGALALQTSLVGALVVALELTQAFIPRRSCDIRDIAAGLLGVVIATLPRVSWRRSGRTLQRARLVGAVE